MLNPFVIETSIRHQCANVPITLGGFDPATIGWYVLLVLYACLTVYAIAVFISTKRETTGKDEENVSQVYSVSLCTSKDADGNPCWSATSLDAEGVIGVGDSPALAVDNLLSQVDKQKVFDKTCTNKEEKEKERDG